MRIVLATLLLVSLFRPTGAADAETLSSIVKRSVDGFIRPGYEVLAAEAGTMQSAMGELCKAPSRKTYDKALFRFAGLIDAWSRIELIRFGPVRRENRFEKLNYWPDRKSLGLRQVQRLIAAKDPSALDIARLRQKSVAVQGLGALEFVLTGTGSEGLASVETDTAYRCAYGEAVAGAVKTTAMELVAEWQNDAGYVAVMTQPGAENPVYRSHAEAVQELLRAITQELQFVRDVKLGGPLGKSIAKARPKKAPFWRSDLTVPAVKANMESAFKLFEAGGFIEALPPNDSWLLQSFRFEVGQSFRHLDAAGEGFGAALQDEERRRFVSLVVLALNGVGELIGEYYTERTGLAIGFNSLDGD